ncbi:MAG: hypothetical protein H7067_15330 [Burkholderiales bacterium]|nr:hypothetical protein [Opitutaceae bacterium]
MPAPLSKLLQDTVVSHLTAIAALAGVPVVGRRKGIITNDIEAAVATIGACLYVFPALPVEVNPNLPGPYVSKLQIRVRAIEAPAINETLPDAYELAEAVLTGLHEANFAAVEGLEGINPVQCLSRPIEEIADDERIIFDVTFETSGGLPAST